MREQTKTGLGSGAEAEARCWATVWDWGLAGAFAAVVDVLSDVYDTFVFGASFQGRRGDNLPSDSAHCAASFWMSFVKPSQNFLLIVQQHGATRPKPSAGVSPPAPAKLLYELQYDCNS